MSSMFSSSHSAETAANLQSHYQICGEMLRERDRDRWLACLFAPTQFRRHLHALYAFNQEVARIRDCVANPAPGEIRLQWWIDAIEGEARGDVRAHPVAHALIDTIHKFQLPRTAFTRLIEARRFDLYDDAMVDLEELETYCGHTAASLFRLSSIILSDGRDPGGAAAAGYAGVAYALTGLMRAFPYHAAQGRLYIPADMLARRGVSTGAALTRPASKGILESLGELRAHARLRHRQALEAMTTLGPKGRPAFVGLAVVPLYLRNMDRPDYQPFSDEVDIAQWRRQWAMWRF